MPVVRVPSERDSNCLQFPAGTKCLPLQKQLSQHKCSVRSFRKENESSAVCGVPLPVNEGWQCLLYSVVARQTAAKKSIRSYFGKYWVEYASWLLLISQDFRFLPSRSIWKHSFYLECFMIFRLNLRLVLCLLQLTQLIYHWIEDLVTRTLLWSESLLIWWGGGVGGCYGIVSVWLGKNMVP